MKKEKIIVIGGGGHGRVIVDAIQLSKKYKVSGIVDPKISKGTKILGVKVLGKDSELKDIFNSGIKNAIIGIGSLGDCSLRKRIYSDLKKIGFELPVIIHPKSVIARDVKIKEGTFVAASATINTGSSIGSCVIVNTSSSVDHDCAIRDYVHVAPGVVLSGGVKIGEGTHLGTGAKVIHNINIGKGCFVGAGSVVLKDIKDKQKYCGFKR